MPSPTPFQLETFRLPFFTPEEDAEYVRIFNKGPEYPFRKKEMAALC
jgi:hypothetical protein